MLQVEKNAGIKAQIAFVYLITVHGAKGRGFSPVWGLCRQQAGGVQEKQKLQAVAPEEQKEISKKLCVRTSIVQALLSQSFGPGLGSVHAWELFRSGDAHVFSQNIPSVGTL